MPIELAPPLNEEDIALMNAVLNNVGICVGISNAICCKYWVEQSRTGYTRTFTNQADFEAEVDKLYFEEEQYRL